MRSAAAINLHGPARSFVRLETAKASLERCVRKYPAGERWLVSEKCRDVAPSIL